MKTVLSFLCRHKVGVAIIVVVIGVAVGAAVRCLPSSAKGMCASAVVVESRACWELKAGNKPVLWFAAVDSDSTLVMPATVRRRAEEVRLTGGCWMNRWPGVPSCWGRLVTVLPQDRAAAIAIGRHPTEQQVRQLLAKAQRDIADSLRWAQSEDSELQYYLRVHGVQDEGYQQIASVATKVQAKVAELKVTAAVIDSLLSRPAIVLDMTRRIVYNAHYRNGNGHVATVTCRMVGTRSGSSLSLLQTADRSTPSNVKAQYLLPWNTTNRRLIAVGFGGLGIRELASPSARPQLIAGRRKDGRHDFPRVLVADGCPLFTPRGLFAGIAHGQQMDGRSDVSLLMMKGGWR